MAQVTTKTLYFIDGPIPSAEDIARAAGIPGIVCFRNVRALGASIEAANQVTSADGVNIPTAYTVGAGYARVSPEAPLSIIVVPDAPTIDLSAVEPVRLRAMARWRDGTQTDVTEACTWVSGTPGNATVSNTANTKGNVAPAGVGTSIITATYPFAGEGEVGALHATGQLVISTGVPTAADTVTLGDIVYTWVAAADVADTSSATAVKVAIGANIADSVKNLKNAIMRGPGRGVKYSSDAVKNAKVTAAINADATKLDLKADEIGTIGNVVVSTESGSHTAITGALTALASGANATTGISDTCTVTVVA